MCIARGLRNAPVVSELLALIDQWKDAHGQPSDASIARAIGASRQTLSSWRTRGVRELPDQDTLENLAAFLHLDYISVVLPAVLRDIKYLPRETPDDDDREEPTSSEAG